MKERTVAPWNQHIVYLCYRFGYHINPPSNRCSSRDFLCCLLSRYFLNGCRFDFLSLSPDLTSCPDRSPLFFLFQVVVTRGGMRRSASPRDAPHRIRSFLPLRLGFSSTWPTATRGNAGFNLEHYHQLTYESILHRHDRLSKRSQATLKPTKRGAASISPASGKRGWMASFNCGEGEDRRFNLAHHHQLSTNPFSTITIDSPIDSRSLRAISVENCAGATGPPWALFFCGLSLRWPANGAAKPTPLPSVLS